MREHAIVRFINLCTIRISYFTIINENYESKFKPNIKMDAFNYFVKEKKAFKLVRHKKILK